MREVRSSVQQELTDLYQREITPNDYDLQRLLDNDSNNLSESSGSSFGILGMTFYGASNSGFTNQRPVTKEQKQSWRTFKISHKNDNHYECGICLHNLHKGQIGVELPCTKVHYFHKRCLKKWYNHSNRCPLDNQNMDDI